MVSRRERRCFYLVPFLSLAFGRVSQTRWVLKFQEKSTQGWEKTVVIPPVPREEFNFKHVSRQECKKGEAARIGSARVCFVSVVVCLFVSVYLDHDWSGEWWRGLNVRPGYADACPLHSRVERAVHADLAGGWVGGRVRARGRLRCVQMRQSSEEEGHARRCTQEVYLTLKSCQPT